jgi:hypothetical protein
VQCGIDDQPDTAAGRRRRRDVVAHMAQDARLRGYALQLCAFR